MITSESKSGKPPGIAGLVLFQALLLAYPLLSFLWHRDYPLASGEALMLLALVVLAGTVLAAMLSRARHRVRNLFLAFQTTAVLILQPAEEIGKGALMMIEAGLFEKFPKPNCGLPSESI